MVVLLACFCSPLIFYSSEARGYSLAVLLAIIAYALAPDSSRRDSIAGAGFFSVAIVLGFLAHLTFIYVYAGLIAWAMMDGIKKPRWILLVYHLPAAAVLTLIYFFDVRKLQYGGGPPTSAAVVLRYTLGMIFGPSNDGPLVWIIGLTILTLCSVGLIALSRRCGSGRAAFFIVAIVLTPAALTATRRNPYLATRYFLVCIPFVLMLLSIGLSELSRSWAGKLMAGIVLSAVIFNGLLGTWQLRILGRGHVRDCLLHMAIATPSKTITYRSERMGMDKFNIDYYARTLGEPAQFVPAGDQPPDWWILDLDNSWSIGPPIIHRFRRAYKLDSVYVSGEISGLTWDLYRRAAD